MTEPLLEHYQADSKGYRVFIEIAERTLLSSDNPVVLKAMTNTSNY